MSTENILLGDIQPIAGDSTSCAVEVIESQVRTEPSTAGFFSSYQYARAPQLSALFVSIFCASAAGAAMPLVTIVFGALAEEFINEDEKAVHDVRDRVRHLTLLLVYIAIGSFITTMIGTWGLNVVGEQIRCDLQQRYLSSVLQQNMAYFDVVKTAELMSQLDQDMKLIQAGISQKLGSIISGVSGCVVAITCAFMQNPRFASIMISQPIALILLVGIMGSWMSMTQKMASARWAKADNLAQEVLGAMRTVIAFRSQERFARKYHDYLLRPIALDFRERFVFGVIVAGSFAILHLGSGLGLWQADQLFRQGLCTIPEALSIMYAVTAAGGMICQALPFVVDISQANGAVSRIFSVMERISPINPLADTGKTYGQVRGEIRLENLTFAYPSRPERTVLKGIRLHVPAGHTVALVGPSGSGKSTIFALFERLYLPLDGVITLDDKPIDEMNVSWLRSQIGYVGQDVFLFRASIHDNIAFGLPKSTTEKLDIPGIRKLVIQAAQTAQIHSFIASLPEDYDTMIGANGSNLSGGQRQRLAIARAIISQPSILLLDEATAALDSQSEKEVQEALNRAALGRTTLIIAHRLSTIRDADTIIVMKNGEIIDQGSHAELMTGSAMYQGLIRQQAIRPNDQYQEPSSTRRITKYNSRGDPFNAGARKILDDSPVPEYAPGNSIKQIWRLNKPEMSYIIAGALCSVLAGMTYPVQAIFFGNGIMSIINPDLSTGGNNVQFWAKMYLVHGIIVVVIYCIRGYCFAVSASQLYLRARSRLFKALLLKNLPFLEHENHSTGALVSFLSSGVQKTIGVSGTSLGLVVESVVMLATGIAVGCIFGWKLGVASTATVPLIAISSFLQYYVEAQVQRYVQRDTNAVEFAHETFSAIETVTILGLQNSILASFREQSGGDRRASYWVMSAAMYACATSLRILSIAFVFWYGGTHLIATGEYSIQQFFICFAATVWGSQSAAALFARAPDIAGAHTAAARLTKLMQTDDSSSRLTDNTPKHDLISVPSTIENLSLQHINFRYPTRPSQLALNDVHLDAPAGTFIALVGTTGSGKSSVINLVERFYAAEFGEITLGNTSIEAYDLNSYRRYLALVDQNPCLVGQDLRECLQSDERVSSDEEILAALENVDLVDFVLSLPQGLSTPILSNGSNLSGGQRQRIAIAKALLWGPEILILDEATSALDSASEEVVQKALQQAMKGRTIIAVAHRLKTIVNANMIFVFDHGQIIERGSHDELFKLGGKYWQMAKLQQLDEQALDM
ncbi:P-loop containing nucleoside triphosphate hydrolase protein [Penicillium robsamsonii]|uniref:P-loop containing nucleoside triphosphate hydrolase protein n=1 Tax=Penicillium robsamsonii TaxID=1792511 RepID=UPI00254930B3|nr:P-loop containing nucleoside triphosphate hydrolase protein [Penicillium robsamsonii]KAJ5827873.1 P-loop containing nucleoside triphosphate hydrolase protein [Penicillium robsamsonii]